jgi:sulfatase modifying factor 1
MHSTALSRSHPRAFFKRVLGMTNRIAILSLVYCAILLLAPQSFSAVTIAWSPVSNPGNAKDPFTGYGAVPYAYNIGTYDVTASQYAEFLNAKDPTGANALGLYNGYMGSRSSLDVGGGIDYTPGGANGSNYSVISGLGNHPAVATSWYDAIRFANWLNNGQGNGDTETGAYTLGSLWPGGIPFTAPLRHNAGAKIWLPTENEWYKAAYYNPATRSYFLYPTSSNTRPTDSLPTALPNHVNMLPGGPFGLTDVGAYTGTTSPYGAFDMGGNVGQWNENFVNVLDRGVRGSSFFNSFYNPNVPLLQSWYVPGGVPSREVFTIGFRVASIANIPEPSTGMLAIIACGALWWCRSKAAGSNERKRFN